MARHRGGDAVERASVALHHVVPARAVDVHVDEAGNHRHAGGDVIDGVRRQAHFIAMADRCDAAAFDDDHAVADLFVRRQNAAGVDNGSRHGSGGPS